MANFVHFVGIGGISMSGIAKVLLNNGTRVSGSDISDSETVRELKSLGAEIFIGQSSDNITDQDLVVYTSAVKDDNPELIRAKEKGIRIIDRATMLGMIMKDYSTAVSIAGTHGKTTATSMMAYIMIEASLDPTVMVGGKLDGIDGNLRIGKSEYFVAETCEYMRNFLKFFPTVAVILNVEEDHLDYYRDIDDIIGAFHDFASLVPDDGVVISNADNLNAMKSVRNINAKVYTFGLNDADFVARNIRFSDEGYPSFEIYNGGQKFLELDLNVVGRHNVLNATAVALAAYKIGIDAKYIKAGLESFCGTKRRFERKGTVNGALVIDDYAHHPTEIAATLAALSKIDYNQLWCIFQPHTYTRTYTLFDKFKEVFTDAGNIIFTDIYAAREKDTGLISSAQLAEQVPNSVYISSFEEIKDYIRQNASEGDIVLTMGAGNVYRIGDDLVK